ncbi:uncharacterized protein B0T23DRAFT_394946 [Neurospora hispaniola]|uniref:Uncharacterized protein n=1 Tax=Neurospora hispaniola TaxID=588809 RepID=A0AAJ0IAQ9_9PEZI|nr:hypothetical protein B0T23DRAFT_394946 [Neurospora hispaniola]
MAAGVLWQAIQLRPCHHLCVSFLAASAAPDGPAAEKPKAFGSCHVCLGYADPTINWRRNGMEFPFDQQKVHRFITSMDIAVGSVGVGQRFFQLFDKGEGLSSESIKIANGSKLGGLGVKCLVHCGMVMEREENASSKAGVWGYPDGEA